jgi:hypothetical protein
MGRTDVKVTVVGDLGHGEAYLHKGKVDGYIVTVSDDGIVASGSRARGRGYLQRAVEVEVSSETGVEDVVVVVATALWVGAKGREERVQRRVHCCCGGGGGGINGYDETGSRYGGEMQRREQQWMDRRKKERRKERERNSGRV